MNNMGGACSSGHQICGGTQRGGSQSPPNNRNHQHSAVDGSSTPVGADGHATSLRRRLIRHSVDTEVADTCISNLYPLADNYVNDVPNNSKNNNNLTSRSPKSLTELCIDAVCRSLPDLMGELPPGLPQNVVDGIANSLVRHSALNATTLRALRLCEVGHLSLAGCRGVSDEWLSPLSNRSCLAAANATSSSYAAAPTNSSSAIGCSSPGTGGVEYMDLTPCMSRERHHQSDLMFKDDDEFEDDDGEDTDAFEDCKVSADGSLLDYQPLELSSLINSEIGDRTANSNNNTSNKEDVNMLMDDGNDHERQDVTEENKDLKDSAAMLIFERQDSSSSSSSASYASASSNPLSEVPHPNHYYEFDCSQPLKQDASTMSMPKSCSTDYSTGTTSPVSPPLQQPILQSSPSLTTNLTSLDIRGSQRLTDRGLVQLSDLRNLEVAKLDHCHSIVGRGMVAFASSRRLHTLSMVNCRRLSDEAIINISHLTSLTALSLDGCRCLTDRALSAMSNLYNIRKLDLSQCDLISDDGLASLYRLELLEELSLGWCRSVSDRGVEVVCTQPGRMEHVKVLRLARCPITDEGIEHVGRLRALEELDLNGCAGVSGAALGSVLQKLENLTSLDVSYCPGILRLSWQGKINGLKSLELCYSGVRDAHLSRLNHLPALEELNLDSCPVGDWAIAHLSDGVVPNLTALDLADTDVTDTGMAHISKFTKMTRLSLFYCNISNAGLRHLSSMTTLEALNLDSREIDDEGLSYLCCLNRLKSLDLFSGRITDAGCVHLSKIKSLESLELCGGGIADRGCSNLASLENLTSLNLSQNERITNRGAAALAALSKLKGLNLSNTRVNAGALKFLGGLTNLQSLAMYGCQGIDDQGSINMLQSELPSLKCLRLNQETENNNTNIADTSPSLLWGGNHNFNNVHDDDDDDDDMSDDDDENASDDDDNDMDEQIMAVHFDVEADQDNASHEDDGISSVGSNSGAINDNSNQNGENDILGGDLVVHPEEEVDHMDSEEDNNEVEEDEVDDEEFEHRFHDIHHINYLSDSPSDEESNGR